MRYASFQLRIAGVGAGREFRVARCHRQQYNSAKRGFGRRAHGLSRRIGSQCVQSGLSRSSRRQRRRTFSVWLRGNAGGEQTYIHVTIGGTYYTSPRITLTTQWQRFTVVSSALIAGTWAVQIGTDLRDVAQAATSAQTIYTWGGQVEAGGFVTSYIPTTSAAVTRAADVAVMPTDVSWFNAPTYSVLGEFDLIGTGNATVVSLGSTDINDTTFLNVITAFYYRGSQAISPAAIGGGATNKSVGRMSNFDWLRYQWLRRRDNGGKFCCAINSNAACYWCDSWKTLDGPLNGHIRRVTYWPRVLSDAELQQATT